MTLAWTSAQISHEVLKALPPSVAHADSSTSVQVIADGFFVVTTLKHAHVNISIFRLVSHTVDAPPIAKLLLVKATAGNSVPSLEMRGCHDRQISAVALTDPSAPFRACKAKHKEPAVGFARQVLKAGILWQRSESKVRILLSHDANLLNRFALWSEPADVCASVRLVSFYGCAA
jgi:hypothetical protein